MSPIQEEKLESKSRRRGRHDIENTLPRHAASNQDQKKSVKKEVSFERVLTC